jgi:hypothetical protein
MMRLVQHVYLIFRLLQCHESLVQFLLFPETLRRFSRCFICHCDGPPQKFPVFYTCRRRDWDRVLHVLVLSA